jgi:hypothetical protein
VADLATDYFTLDEAMDLLKMPRSIAVAFPLREQPYESKTLLLKKDIVMARRRSG